MTAGSDLDIYLLITAAVGLLLAVVALTGSADEFSFVSAATFLLGLVGAILVISWLTFDFPDGAERKIEAYIGLGAVIVIAIGGFRAMQEEVAGEI
jgi:apolipoprotein N-acyltransferase